MQLLSSGNKPSGGREIDRRALAAVAVLALAALAGCTGPNPKPTVCAVCQNASVSDQVGSSRVHVQVFANGSSRWTVRARPADGRDGDAETAAETMAAAVRDGDYDGAYPPGEGRARNVAARADGDAAVVSYVVDDVARERPGGFLLVDAFNQPKRDGGDPFRLGARAVEVTAPPGMAVSSAPPGATVTDGGRSVVWERSGAGPAELPYGTYVAFGPDRSLPSRAVGTALVWLDVAAWAGPTLLVALVVAALVVGGVAALLTELLTDGRLRRALAAPRRRPSRRRVAAALLPVLAVVAATTATGPPDGRLSWLVTVYYVVPAGVVAFAALGAAVGGRRWYALPLGSFLLAVPLPTAVTMALEGLPATVVVWLFGLALAPVAVVGGAAYVVAFRAVAGRWRVTS